MLSLKSIWFRNYKKITLLGLECQYEILCNTILRLFGTLNVDQKRKIGLLHYVRLGFNE